MAAITHTHTRRPDWRTGARIIAAITAKDIVEGLKNRTTASVILLAVGFVALWRVLPALESRSAVPIVRVFDAGRSSLLPALEASSAVDVTAYASQAQLRRQLAEAETPELGLLIPADFDQVRTAGGTPELQGLVLHWVSPADAARLQQRVEAALAELAGGPVRIRLENGRVYLPVDARGLGLTATWSTLMVFLMLGLSFLPNLMFEEKRTRTLDALLISPASAGQVTAAKALTGLFYTALCVAVAYAFYYRLITQWWLAVLAAACGASFSVGLGLLLGVLLTSRQQLMIAAQPLIVFLFGPLILSDLTEWKLLPSWVATLNRWTPTVGIETMLRVSYSNQSAPGLWVPALGVVVAWTALLLALVAWRLSRASQ
jgi:hypothetical protein